MDFVKEQGQQIPQQEESQSVEEGKTPDDTQEYLTVAAKDKDVRKTTYLLAFLFVIGLLCLGIMIKKSTLQTAIASAVTTEESQIEAAIAQLTGVKSEMFSRLDEIVNKFYQFSDIPQVKVNELVKNPFKHQLAYGIDTLANIDQASADMQLLSIMRSGKDNASQCCMIDDKILYEGDSIRGFKVLRIGNNFVKLGLKGTELVLRLSE